MNKPSSSLIIALAVLVILGVGGFFIVKSNTDARNLEISEAEKKKKVQAQEYIASSQEKLVLAGKTQNADEKARYIQEAIVDARNATTLDPNNYETFFNLGTIYTLLAPSVENSAEFALASFDKAIELNSNCGKCYRNAGLVYAHLGKTAEAKINFQKAYDLEPEGSAEKAMLEKWLAE